MAGVRVRVVVISPDPTLGPFLHTRLPQSWYDVVTMSPGSGMTQSGPPEIAVVDRVDQRPEAAAAEIAALKGRYPEVQVIAVSARSTEADARVLEQGVFFYLAARPMTDLVRLIEGTARGKPGRGGVTPAAPAPALTDKTA